MSDLKQETDAEVEQEASGGRPHRRQSGALRARIPFDRATVVDTLFRFQSLFGLAVVILLAIVFSPVRSGTLVFLEPANIGNIIRAVSEIGILAVGMTFVILTGGIDLSVGSVLGLAAVGTATFFTIYNAGIPLTVLAILAIGLAFGFVQGTITTKLGLQAFIVTLAGLQGARGLARIWSNNQSIPITYGEGPRLAPEAFSIMNSQWFGFLPFPAVLFLVVGIIGALVLRFTTFGRHVYAIGSNEKVARLSGLPVDRVKIAVFCICGMLAAFAGIVHAGQLNLGNPAAGFTYELQAIAAVVIGGTSLFGGRGTMVGTIAGALIFGVLDNILTLRGISENIQLVVTAVVIVAAVAVQQLRPGGSQR